MSWSTNLVDILIKSGNLNLRNILNDGINEYLRKFDIESHSDPVLLINALIAVWGPKILENKEIRMLMVRQLSPNDLRTLSVNMGLHVVDLPPNGMAREIVSSRWGWTSKKTKSFCDFFKLSGVIEEYKRMIMDFEEIDAPAILDSQLPEDRFYELHTFQSDVRDQILQRFLVYDESKILLQLPTGGGKTRTALHTVIRYMLNANLNRKNVLWLAYDPLLLDQALQAFMQLWPFLGVGPIGIKRMYGGHKDIIDSGRNICFASVVSLKNCLNEKMIGLLRRNVSMIIFDEAHQVIANEARKIINDLLFKNNEIKMLGLTATPGRNYFDATENERFRKYFSNIITIDVPPEKTFFGNMRPDSADRTAINYLQGKNILAKLDHSLLDYGKVPTKRNRSSLANDCYNKQTLRELAHDSERNNCIIKKIVDLVNDNKKILVFACSVEHAENLCFLLKLEKVNTALILGKNKDLRAEAIKRFRFTDKLNVLINYDVLTAGFDAPEIDALVIARPTSSLVTYSQMLGRALRGPMNGGHVENKIINVSDPIFGEENEAYRKFNTYWRNYGE